MVNREYCDVRAPIGRSAYQYLCELRRLEEVNPRARPHRERTPFGAVDLSLGMPYLARLRQRAAT